MVYYKKNKNLGHVWKKRKKRKKRKKKKEIEGDETEKHFESKRVTSYEIH